MAVKTDGTRPAALLADGALLLDSDRSPAPPHSESAVLAAIAGAVGDAILVWDLDARITHWNGSAQRQYGYTASEATGHTLELFTPPEDRAAARALFDLAIGGKQSQQLELVRVTADGRRLRVVVRCAPVLDEAGSVERLVTVEREVTRSRADEAQLAELLQRERTTREAEPSCGGSLSRRCASGCLRRQRFRWAKWRSYAATARWSCSIARRVS